MQGDRTRIMVVDIVRDPAEFGKSKEFTFVRAGTPAAVADSFVQQVFDGGAIAYVSSGPEIVYWGAVNAGRQTFGVDYVPGTERWRAVLRVKSKVPLKQVTIYDSETVLRRYAVSGNTLDLSFDGLHDNRHVLTAVVEDQDGGRATSGVIETFDRLLYEYFCSDRCNIMGGQTTLRDKRGFHRTSPATDMLYKAGRLCANRGVREHCAIDRWLRRSPIPCHPGFPDERGRGPQRTASPAPCDFASLRERELHHLRHADHPQEPSPGNEVFGHNPYVDVVLPDKVDFRLVQYAYYRNPDVPTAMIAEFTMKAKKDGIELKKGWNDFSVLMGGVWGRFKTHYAIVRADGTTEQGRRADRKTGTAWRGTLKPGDSLLLPEIGEGFCVLDGDNIDMAVNCEPSKKTFSLSFGRFDTGKIEKGQGFCQRIAMAKIAADPAKSVDAWRAYLEQFGMTGKTPAYSVTARQGQVVSKKFPVAIEADRNGFAGTFRAGGAAAEVVCDGERSQWEMDRRHDRPYAEIVDSAWCLERLHLSHHRHQ